MPSKIHHLCVLSITFSVTIDVHISISVGDIEQLREFDLGMGARFEDLSFVDDCLRCCLDRGDDRDREPLDSLR